MGLVHNSDNNCKKESAMYQILKRVCLASILLLAITLSSCNFTTKNLTRSKAASLIENSAKFSEVKSKINLHPNGLEKGFLHDMWGVVQGEPGTNYSIDYYALSPNQDVFQLIQATVLPGSIATVTMKKPVETQINVTGITDAPIMQGVKEAQFTWEYTNLPSIVKRYVVRGGSGVAYLRLYDDGWRIEDLKVSYSKEPASLTAKERAEEEAEDRKREETIRRSDTGKSQLIFGTGDVSENTGLSMVPKQLSNSQIR